MNDITLKSGREQRVRRGHPWIFSNEVKESPRAYRPGELVRVKESKGNVVGTAYVNPRSLIIARLVAGAPEQLDAEFFHERFAAALRRRQDLLPDSGSCRLVYGEGDGLPGLVVDRFDDQLVVQTHTVGMDERLPQIIEALVRLLSPRAIIERNDISARGLEGLAPRSGLIHGETDGRATVREADVRIAVDLLRGQKTGYYFDQRDNRILLARFARGRRVLDLFCYVGSWSLVALAQGARETLGVDSSARAIELARENAETNGFSDRTQWLADDAEGALSRLTAARERFGVVIVDPPAYVKSAKKLFAGLRKYRMMNERAIALLEPGGFLVSCSCSHHVGGGELLDAVGEAARHAGRQALVVARGGLPPDHPVPAAVREADYLKCFVLQVD